MKLKLAIIGHGFVGKAVDYGFTHNMVEKTIIDPKYGTTTKDLPEDIQVAIVCVPTPMGDDGSIDATILNSVMSDLLEMDNIKLILIKSTVTPDIIKKYSSVVVYNPEFLTERSAKEDFINPPFHIFGGDPQLTALAADMYNTFSICNPCTSYFMSAQEASFAKYAINSFLALKVTFFNQLYDAVCDTDANYSSIMKVVGLDSRIGHSHTKVPGPDGKQGYGGACFPKDTAAFTKFSNRLTLLEECIKINNTYRSKYELDEREKEQNVNYGQTKEELKDQTD
jgi:UDPglucose 6-dehydrogenase